MSPLATKKWTFSKIVRKLEPYLLLLPAVALFGLFTYYPFIRTILNSFTLVNRAGLPGEFVGLENYQRVLADKNFTDAILNTFKYVLIAVPTTIIIAFCLALLANKRRRASRVYETMFSMPMAMSLSVTILLFQFMLNPGLGIINHWLGTRTAWFADPKYMLPVLIVICIWLNIGFDFVYLLAAVRAVPVDLIECSNIEGAGFFKRTFHITIPMVSPSLFFLLCTELTKAMMMAAPMVIIGVNSTTHAAGSDFKTIMYYVYLQGMRNFNFSYAFAATVIAFLLTFAFILASFMFERKGVHYS